MTTFEGIHDVLIKLQIFTLGITVHFLFVNNSMWCNVICLNYIVDHSKFTTVLYSLTISKIIISNLKQGVKFVYKCANNSISVSLFSQTLDSITTSRAKQDSNINSLHVPFHCTHPINWVAMLSLNQTKKPNIRFNNIIVTRTAKESHNT